MFEVTPENALDYLRERGHLREGPATVQWLAWGVSNVVLRVQPAEGPAFVVKQSREQLRTKADWFSRIDRIWREMDVMGALVPLLPAGSVPRILFEERENYLFGMEAINASHVVWKQELLDGTADAMVAGTAGTMLAAIHRTTFESEDLRPRLDDREVFDQLRLDPFYRRVASVHVDLQPPLERLIHETLSRSDCVVHADFSPKNLLIVRDGGTLRQLALVDYETGHYGDPAFDLGFFFSHLLLKVVRQGERGKPYADLARTAWHHYRTGVAPLADSDAFAPEALDVRAIAHLGGCMIARVDGKSPVDYLAEPAQQQRAREFARSLLLDPPERFEEAFDRLEAMPVG